MSADNPSIKPIKRTKAKLGVVTRNPVQIARLQPQQTETVNRYAESRNNISTLENSPMRQSQQQSQKQLKELKQERPQVKQSNSNTKQRLQTLPIKQQNKNPLTAKQQMTLNTTQSNEFEDSKSIEDAHKPRQEFMSPELYPRRRTDQNRPPVVNAKKLKQGEVKFNNKGGKEAQEGISRFVGSSHLVNQNSLDKSPAQGNTISVEEQTGQIKPLYDQNQDLINSSINSKGIRADIKSIFKNNRDASYPRRKGQKEAAESSSSVVYKNMIQASQNTAAIQNGINIEESQQKTEESWNQTNNRFKISIDSGNVSVPPVPITQVSPDLSIHEELQMTADKPFNPAPHSRAGSNIRIGVNGASVDGEVVRHAYGSNMSGSQDATAINKFQPENTNDNTGNQRYLQLLQSSTATVDQLNTIVPVEARHQSVKPHTHILKKNLKQASGLIRLIGYGADEKEGDTIRVQSKRKSVPFVVKRQQANIEGQNSMDITNQAGRNFAKSGNYQTIDATKKTNQAVDRFKNKQQDPRQKVSQTDKKEDKAKDVYASEHMMSGMMQSTTSTQLYGHPKQVRNTGPKQLASIGDSEAATATTSTVPYCVNDSSFLYTATGSQNKQKSTNPYQQKTTQRPAFDRGSILDEIEQIKLEEMGDQKKFKHVPSKYAGKPFPYTGQQTENQEQFNMTAYRQQEKQSLTLIPNSQKRHQSTEKRQNIFGKNTHSDSYNFNNSAANSQRGINDTSPTPTKRGLIPEGDTDVEANYSSTLKYTRDALLKLKQSIDQGDAGVLAGFNQTPISKSQYKVFKPESSAKQSLGKKNTINLGKLSMALKPHLSPSPHANFSSAEKQFMPLDGDINNIASILHETLQKLKRPNKHFLKPLQHATSSVKSSAAKDVQEKPQPQPKEEFKSYRKRKLLPKGKKEKKENESAPSAPQQDQKGEDNSSDEMLEEVDLDLDELTQEDKFYLIQQIETIQTNIRYITDKNPSADQGQKEAGRTTYVFEDFDEDEVVKQPDQKQQPQARQPQRYVQSTTPEKQTMQSKDKSPVARRASFSQVHGYGIRESLEIIEDAEEIEEEEAESDGKSMPKLTTQASIIFDLRNNNQSPIVTKKQTDQFSEFAFGNDKPQANEPRNVLRQVIDRDQLLKAKALSETSDIKRQSSNNLSSCDEILADDSDEDNAVLGNSPDIKTAQVTIKPFQIRRLQNSLFLDGPICEQDELQQEREDSSLPDRSHLRVEQQREDEAQVLFRGSVLTTPLEKQK